MSGHRIIMAETYPGPIRVHVDGGAEFTCHSIELRKVPIEDGGSIHGPLTNEYEIVLRIRPTETGVRFTVDDLDVQLSELLPQIGLDQ